ncbi:protein of unknown function (plasmid) [Azospirillum baldaniorum]|uniref:DNA-directed RNA polymerase subunit omega n=1 Tax=Azospirillum baldaniorum TaxID=1064539 RepID=A0A9P1NPV0_9PROT|nr:protein of unknown function [Azospirillum baldaniorum]
MMAAQRAREIASGAPLSIDRDNDKNPVVALREIADETVMLEHLKNALIKGHQKHVEPDEPEEEIVELMAGEHDWAARGDTSLEDEDGMSEAEEVGRRRRPAVRHGERPGGGLRRDRGRRRRPRCGRGSLTLTDCDRLWGPMGPLSVDQPNICETSWRTLRRVGWHDPAI